MIVSLCGKSGSGKSTVANLLESESNGKIVVLDIDKIGHKVLTFDSVKNELVKVFGKNVVKNGKVDRKELGNITFSSTTQMDKLTDITWKYMEIEIDKFISENSNKTIILDWQLIPKTKYFNMSDIKILIDTSYDIRLQRAMKRDGISKSSFDLRDKASIDYSTFSFDYIFKTNDYEKIKKVVCNNMTRVLYPGSFNPITKGHMNIIKQASQLFDEVVIAVMNNPRKEDELFSISERVGIIKELYKDADNIKVVCDGGASVDVAIKYNCKAIVRGLRTLSDYDYEVQMQEMNKDISNGKINTICLFADREYQFISSSIVREVFYLGKDISKYVEPLVEIEMNKKHNLK